jgi:zinc protease
LVPHQALKSARAHTARETSGRAVRFAFLAIACLAPAVCAAKPAAPGPPRYQDMVRETVLPNGLRVLLLQDRKAPVVSFQVWYRVGSRDEIPGKTGLAHLLEHMMFKGTKRHGPKTFSRMIGRNGGDDNAFTSEDQTVYFENIASDRVEVAVELEADRMMNLQIDRAAFQSERDVVIEERRMRTEDDPTGDLAEQLDSVSFSAHPYRNPVIGWMEDIRGLTREDALAFYKTYYRPSNAVVVAVGDFDNAAMLALIRKHFGPLPKLPPPVKRKFGEPVQRGARRLVLRRPAELPSLLRSYHAPRLDDRDFGALEVIDAILSQGRSARLLQSLVYKQQIAASVSADYDGVNIDPRGFMLYAQLFPGRKLEEAEAALEKEIALLKEGGVTPADIAKAKTQIEASWYRTQDSMFYRGMLIGQYEMAADWRTIDAYLPAIRKVQVADVQRAARRVFTPANATTATLVPTRPPARAAAPAPHGGIR